MLTRNRPLNLPKLQYSTMNSVRVDRAPIAMYTQYGNHHSLIKIPTYYERIVVGYSYELEEQCHSVTCSKPNTRTTVASTVCVPRGASNVVMAHLTESLAPANCWPMSVTKRSKSSFNSGRVSPSFRQMRSSFNLLSREGKERRGEVADSGHLFHSCETL